MAIACAMAMDPEVLLLDEPTSALDPTMVDEVEDVIRRFVSLGVTTLIVTHDMAFAREISTRVFYMDEGVVYEEGTPEQIYESPRRAKTIAFVRKQAVLEADIYDEEFDFFGFLDQAAQLEVRARVRGKVWTHAMVVLDEIVLSVQESYKAGRASAPPHIHTMFVCGKGSVTLRLSYNGERFNYAEELERMARQPKSLTDERGWDAATAKIILSFCEDISYTYAEGDELPNQTEFHIH
ncbi:MAG: amino acid ABC transporter ATP-binding protein [Kiritimatiellae bacterium]|nr:amino acid ABC transporter ATP-binding protein [Kiritimatiellia bacterium]